MSPSHSPPSPSSLSEAKSEANSRGDGDKHDNSGLILRETARRYWRANLRILAILLSIWAGVSFGFSILFVEALNEIEFFGFQLGFWWAQQGAIYVFVGLVFIYAVWMKRVETRFGMGDEEGKKDRGSV